MEPVRFSQGIPEEGRDSRGKGPDVPHIPSLWSPVVSQWHLQDPACFSLGPISRDNTSPKPLQGYDRGLPGGGVL